MFKTIFPLSNGLGLYSNDKLLVGFIDDYGQKHIKGEEFKKEKKFLSFPFLRGLCYLFKGIYLYFKTFLLQINSIAKEDENRSHKVARTFNSISAYFAVFSLLIFSFLVGLLLLSVLPSFLLKNLLMPSDNYYLFRLLVALFRVAIIYLLLLLARFLPFFSGIYAFNGAGNFYMSGGGKFRDRCYPLNFLNFLVNVFLFSTFVISLISVNVHIVANFFINLAIFLFISSLCYELLYLFARVKNEFVKDLAVVTAHLVAIKPSATQIEIMDMVKIESESKNGFFDSEKGQIPLSVVFSEMQTKLRQSERFDKSDMEWIVATILGKSRTEIKLLSSVSEKEYREIMRACDRRAKGEPLSSIFGFVEFYGLKFDVNKRVLSPRIDTEVLVEEALKKIKANKLEKVLDLCTGSGVIAITIAKLSLCKVDAVDISKQALSLAEHNAKKNDVKVQFIHSDLFKELKKSKKYDIIISNPPYIKSEDIEKLDSEVKNYDPRLALDGGADGLDFYRKIISQSKSYLTQGGYLFFEVGYNQAEDVEKIMKENGFALVVRVKDYNKIERVVYGRISK